MKGMKAYSIKKGLSTRTRVTVRRGSANARSHWSLRSLWRARRAFTAFSRRLVDDFYRAALEAGGKGNGAPGLRPHYHANYDAAFVHDLDGHNIEAVSDCFLSPPQARRYIVTHVTDLPTLWSP